MTGVQAGALPILVAEEERREDEVDEERRRAEGEKEAAEVEE